MSSGHRQQGGAGSSGPDTGSADRADETVPLFSAEDEAEGYPAARVEQDEHNSTGRNTPAAEESRYPPPKYLKSTYTSREHEFDASDDYLDDGGTGDDQARNGGDDLPVLTGLLQSARSRGSIDTHHRRGSSSSSIGDADAEAAAHDNGLVLGGGQGGGILASVSNMSNSIIGAGIIGLPYAVREAGFFTGIALLVGLGIVTDWTIRLIVVNAKLTGQKTYSDIMEACFGYKGRAAVAFIQFAMAFGGMCAFAVILGDTIPHVLTAIMPSFADTGIGGFLLSRQVVTVVLTIFVSYPLSLYRDIDKLSKASALALVSMGIIIVTVLVEGPTLDPALKGSDSPFTIIDGGFFEAVGVISFAYVCHHNTLLIYGSLVTPTLDRWNKITHISMAISVAASLVMALSGYIIFSDRTRGNILNNFPSDHFWANLARLCFGLNMMTTTPLEAFVCREVFENFFYQDQPFDQRRHVLVTTALIVCSLGVSLMTCDLGLVLELTGGFSATCLAYIFPAACSLSLSSDRWSHSKYPTWACMAFGVVVCVLATTLSIAKAGSKPHKVC